MRNMNIQIVAWILLVFLENSESKESLTVDPFTSTYSHNQTGAWSFTGNVSSKQCFAQRGKRILPRETEIRCCRSIYQRFLTSWADGGQYLTELLSTLKLWNCSQFVKECSNPLFDFNEFSKTVYKRACNYDTFVSDCYEPVKHFAVQHGLIETQTMTRCLNESLETRNRSACWFKLAGSLRHYKTNDVGQLPACVQVALYDQSDNFGQFHEVVFVSMPFCSVIWCGAARETFENNWISVWTCMSNRCRSGKNIVTIFLALLSCLILLTNGIVLLVFFRNKKIRNSQGIYKMSLAFADMIVASVVIPSIAVTLHTIVNHRRELSHARPSQRKAASHGISFGLSSSYQMAIGFFTSVSLIVSVYTLMVASFDRLSLMRDPLKYNSHKAKRVSKLTSAILWLVGLFFASLPFYINTLTYSVIDTAVISFVDVHAIYIYIFVFAVPLLVMWLATTAASCYSFRHARQREGANFSLERRLTKTLIIMVAVFSFSLLPAIASAMWYLFSDGIFYYYVDTLDIRQANILTDFEFISIIILICNSSWNFFIYNARSRSFKKGARSLFKDLFSKFNKVSITTTQPQSG